MRIIIVIILGLIRILCLYSQTIEVLGNSVYEFSSGIYNMLDSPVNIRNQPNLTGSVIGRLELHSEIEILEKTDNVQTIEGIPHYWYKMKYNNIVGYIWGGYIGLNILSIQSTVLDNNRKMYFYFRVSNMIKNYIGNSEDGRIEYYRYFESILPDDIFIYINNERISTKAFEEIYYRYNFHRSGQWTRFASNGRFDVKVNGYIDCITELGFTELWFYIRRDGTVEFIAPAGP